MNSPREQASPYQSPWSFGRRLKMVAWQFCWFILCRWTPKPFNPWRLFVLRLFGASIKGLPFVHQGAKILAPWNVTLNHRACLGDGATAYSLGKIILAEGCTVAQEAYLCAGTHDFNDPSLALVVGEIKVRANAFLGARVFVLPSVSIGEDSIVGACSVVTKDVGVKTVVAGNPAHWIRDR